MERLTPEQVIADLIERNEALRFINQALFDALHDLTRDNRELKARVDYWIDEKREEARSFRPGAALLKTWRGGSKSV